MICFPFIMIILVGCGYRGWKQEFSLEAFAMGQVRDDRGLDWSPW